MDKTNRGFGILRFEDANGIACSMQESSACRNEGLLWLGTELKNKVKVMKQGRGWTDVDLGEQYGAMNVLINDRMHLTQSQVKDMLPYLKYFAKHGTLPEGDL